MINYKLKIETQSEKVLSSDITFVSGDVRAYKFTFDFFDGGVPIDIENCLLVVRARRADGKCIEDAGEVIDGKGVYEPQNSIFAIPGEVRLEIALCDSAKSYITAKIIIAEVIEGVGNECETGGEEISVFVTLMNQVQSKIETANKLIEESIPQIGTDYWTEEDKAEIVCEVVEKIDATLDEKVEPFIITFETIIYEDGSIGIAGDKTYSEVYEAITQRRKIIGKRTDTPKNCYFEFINMYGGSSSYLTLTTFESNISYTYTCWKDSYLATNGWKMEYFYIPRTQDLLTMGEGKDVIDENLGDIETALDRIVEIQNTLIGGDA